MKASDPADLARRMRAGRKAKDRTQYVVAHAFGIRRNAGHFIHGCEIVISITQSSARHKRLPATPLRPALALRLALTEVFDARENS